MANKLSKKEGRRIAYKAIFAWTGEHCREDTQFFDTDSKSSKLCYGFDVFNEQHRQVIIDGFKEIHEMISKEYAKLHKPNKKFDKEMKKIIHNTNNKIK